MSQREWTPGASQTRSKQWQVFGGAQFPQYAEAVLGSTVRADGKHYTDWIAGLGAIGIGYRDPRVESAVRQQEGLGVTFPLPTRLEEEVAQALCEALGWPEQVRWVKTGSEATAAAMMIARRATGRRKIVSLGYHGWHEYHLPGPDLVSVPLEVGSGLYGFYNAWRVVWDELDARTAAVIIEATRNIEIERNEFRNLLENLCKRCTDTGALMILDEMVTGFRWAVGGICEYCKIVPDLACYGKALGNGYPIACVVGPRHLMKHAVDVSSTFGGECVGLAAAREVLKIYQRELVIQTLWNLGTRLLDGCRNILTGWPVHPVFRVGANYTTSERAIPIVQWAAQHGHLLHPAGFNIMYAHTKDQVDDLVEVLNLFPGDDAVVPVSL